MDKLSKPGIIAQNSIKFSAKKKSLLLLLFFVWLVPAIACTRSVKYPDAPPTLIPFTPQPATQAAQETAAVIQGTEISENPASTLEIDPSISPTAAPPILYYTQAGDTVPLISVRFGVNPDEINSPEALPPTALLKPNLLLIIPNRLTGTGPDGMLFPDSEVVFSPSAKDFDVEAFIEQTNGYLSTYSEWLSGGKTSGADIIKRIAIDNSINPMFLLAILEYQSGWVYGQPSTMAQTEYPIGYIEYSARGLYQQLAWAVEQLSLGYYGWRAGTLTELVFGNYESLRIAPTLNAGTVAVQYLFSKLYYSNLWAGNLYSPDGFPALHERMFGNYWVRSQTVEPLYPPDITQPNLELPFHPGVLWSLTGGPHSVWDTGGALGALDFAPASEKNGCLESLAWVTAAAPGLVVRVDTGVVIVDLDGDGSEQTGWNILYLHIATKGKVAVGTYLNQDDPIGHPSCEGGKATGTHLHIARKYNGEWILADGPMPFVLSGWTAHNGLAAYKGNLTKDDQIITASQVGSYESRIIR